MNCQISRQETEYKMMDVDNDTAVLFDGKVETVEYQPTAYNDGILWHQQQEVSFTIVL